MDKDIRKYPYNLLVTLFHGDEADKLSNDSDIALEYVINETLTEREAMFLRMRYKEGMTYAEIAEENGVIVCSLIFIAYLIIIYRILKLSTRTKNLKNNWKT